MEIKEIFEDNIEKFQNMQDYAGKHIIHPIIYLCNNKEKTVYYNTQKAFVNLKYNNIQFFNRSKRNIEKENDFNNINGILGEVRCYGYLLECFQNISNIEVNVIPQKSKRFKTWF